MVNDLNSLLILGDSIGRTYKTSGISTVLIIASKRFHHGKSRAGLYSGCGHNLAAHADNPLVPSKVNLRSVPDILMHGSIFASPVAFASMRWSGACRKLQNRIALEARMRMNAKRNASDVDSRQVIVKKPFLISKTTKLTLPKLDFIEWTIDICRKSYEPSIREVTQRTMGFLFAAAFQISAVRASPG